MNRRELLAAMIAVPPGLAISSLQVEKVEPLSPNAVIVFESTEYLTHDAVLRIKQLAKQAWPNHQIVVIDAGLKLRIVGGPVEVEPR